MQRRREATERLPGSLGEPGASRRDRAGDGQERLELVTVRAALSVGHLEKVIAYGLTGAC